MSMRAIEGRVLATWIVTACCVGIAPLRGWIELDMVRHMLLEFPLLLACGAMTASVMPPTMTRLFASLDRLGLTGLTLFACVTAYWMIPAALDAALSQSTVAAAKYASLVIAGCALRLSLQRAPVVLQGFFLGNWAWMTATVGMLYQETPGQLCLYYLEDSQLRAGRGLVIAAIVIGAVWCALAARRWHGETSASRRYGSRS